MRFRWTRSLGGTVRLATVSRDGKHWFVSFLVGDGATAPKQHAALNTAVGVEWGVAAAVATSDGDLLGRGLRTSDEAKRYRWLQQRLSLQSKGSNNCKKTLAAMRRIKRRERNRRTDFCAQVATT